MKLEINYKELQTRLHPSLVDLSNREMSNVDAVLKVVKNVKAVQSELEDYMKAYNTLTTENCVKGEDGNPILEDGKTLSYPDEETKKKVIKKLSDLQMKVVKINLEPITKADLKDLQVSPNLIIGLGKLFNS